MPTAQMIFDKLLLEAGLADNMTRKVTLVFEVLQPPLVITERYDNTGKVETLMRTLGEKLKEADNG